MTELSRKIAIKSGLPEGGLTFDFSANESACCLISRRLELKALEAMSVSGRISRGPREPVIIVQGEITAAVVQDCVVTFDPVRSVLAVPFERYLTSEGASDRDEIIVSMEDEEPEPFDGDEVDVGEIAIEELSLAIDPYPRAPGADEVLSHLLPQNDDAEAEGSPFGRLQALKRRPD